MQELQTMHKCIRSSFALFCTKAMLLLSTITQCNVRNSQWQQISLSNMQEFPTIRFRAGKPSATGATDHQSLVAQKIAVEVDSRLGDLQRSAQIPSSETSELIITDRYHAYHATYFKHFLKSAVVKHWLKSICHRRHSHRSVLKLLCLVRLIFLLSASQKSQERR